MRHISLSLKLEAREDIDSFDLDPASENLAKRLFKSVATRICLYGVTKSSFDRTTFRQMCQVETIHADLNWFIVS